MLRILLILWVVSIAVPTSAQKEPAKGNENALLYEYEIPSLTDTLPEVNGKYLLEPDQTYNEGHLLVAKVPVDYNGLILVVPVPKDYNGTLLVLKLGKKGRTSFIKPRPQKGSPFKEQPEKDDKP